MALSSFRQNHAWHYQVLSKTMQVGSLSSYVIQKLTLRPIGKGGFGGLHKTPLLSFFIHMNLYGTYVSHTQLIESRTPLCEKETPLARGCIRA
jgi:hypothetical protein